jgi:hypothetical protein
MTVKHTTSLLPIALLAAVAGAAIAISVIGQPASASPAAFAPAELPGVDTIYENCIKAAGGRKAVDNVKTIQADTTMTSDQGQVQFQQSWSRDGGRLVRVSMPQGEMLMGTDGKTAWMKSPMGYMLAPPDQADQIESQAGMFMFMIDFKKFAKDDMQSLEVVGEEAFQGKDCYKLHFTTEDEKDGHVYFDKESGLPVGFSQEEQGEDGQPGDKSTMLLKDWKEVEGVKFFHLVTMEVEPGPNSPARTMAGPDGKMHAEIKVNELKVNTLEPEHFALPEEVKSLAKSQPVEDDDDGDDAASEIKLEDLPSEQQAEATAMVDNMKQQPPGMLKQLISQLESGIPHMEADRKLFMQYVVQELKKEVASREG